jgi:NAD(P)-dependent dehydrogenase (short-subunit alcohol dehydrogenase family)
MSEPEHKSMAGKRVLVSGSGTGIGHGIALAFARHGADVAFHYSHSDKGAKSGVEKARALGVRAEAFKADFTNVADVQNLARQALNFLGGIDVLVNNAGITMNQPFEKVTIEEFDTLYHVNIRAMFFLTQAVAGDMLKRKHGSVINLTSIHAYEGFRDHSVYAGTKGAIVSFTRQLAIELAPSGIRVNGIAPGAVEVPNYYKAVPEYETAALAKCIPAGFVGMPDDIAEIALFLASEKSRFILGQTLVADGGTTSWMPFSDGFRQPAGGNFGAGYVPGR